MPFGHPSSGGPEQDSDPRQNIGQNMMWRT